MKPNTIIAVAISLIVVLGCGASMPVPPAMAGKSVTSNYGTSGSTLPLSADAAFCDDFEGASLNSFWSIMSAPPGNTASLSTALNHSSADGARQSILLSTAPDGLPRFISLTHHFTNSTKGTVSVYFYDTLFGVPSAGASLSLLGTTPPAFSSGVGVLSEPSFIPPDQLPDPNVYYTFGSQGGATSIHRSSGWHHFVIAVDDSGYKVYIDEILVQSVAGGFKFDNISLNANSFVTGPNATFFFDDFCFTPPVCQVNVTTKWSQGINPQVSGNGPPGGGSWGYETYDDYNPSGGACIEGNASTNCQIKKLGCALTTLSMALKFAGLNSIGGRDLNPGVLNDFMKAGHDFDAAHNVKWDVTTRALLPGKRFIFDDLGSDTQTLERILCSGFPVIVGTNLDAARLPQHYVLVTGKQGDDFVIADPGDHTNTILDTSDFTIRGYVEDPTGDISGLDLSTGTNAELLATDGSGRRTGFDQISSTILGEIPHAVHFVDSLRDDETGTPPNGRSHSVLIFQPAQGTYTITLAGLQLGTYALSVDSFSADGSSKPALLVSGVTAAGSTSSFQIQFAPTPGADTTVARVASPQSTLSDIANSLQLGLIDNQGIANSLSQKIQVAMRSTGAVRINALKAFKNEVQAQAGKHVTGIAAQVLFEDANSLLIQ